MINTATLTTYPGSSITGSSSASQNSGDVDFSSLVSDFEKEIKESPFQRMFDAVLKEHGLTEAAYDRLPAAQKDAIMKEVTDDLKKTMQKGQFSTLASSYSLGSSL